MTPRQSLSLLLLTFGLVVAVSFGVGGYLLLQRHQPARLSSPLSTEVEARDVELLLTVAETHLQRRRTEQALNAYRKLLSLRPDSLEGQLGLALGELQAGREDIAAREFERALTLDRENTRALIEIGRIYARRPAMWSRAEELFREYLRWKPDDADAQLELARVLAWRGSAAEAAAIFARPAVAERMTADDQRNYAFALVKSGQVDRAEPLLRQLVASRPRDVDVKAQLAGIYAARQDWNAALPLYESLVSQAPRDLRLKLGYGLGLLFVKRYRAALSPLREARTGMPSSAEAGLGYARALKETGDLRRASSEFGRVVPRYHNDALIVREYADLLLERKNYRESEKYYREAHALGLRDDPLLLGLAGAMNGSGKPREALPYLEDVYGRQPSERLGFELARTYRRLGDTKRALALMAAIEKSAQTGK